MKAEDCLERVCDLLALWKTHLPDYYGEPINQAAVQRFELCIDELELVLTGKPIP